MSNILIKNTTIATLGGKNRVLENHSLLIEGSVIKKVFPYKPAEVIDHLFDHVIDGRGKLLLPGFINAHMHFYSSFARGLYKADPSANFLDVLKNLWWRLDKKLTLEDSYYSALVACIDAIKFGTTTLIDHHASPGAITGSLSQVAAAVRRSGLRANLCYELSDRDGDRTIQQGIDENSAFIERCQKDNDPQLRALFGLHAAFTLSDETLEKAAEKAKRLGAGFHIHVAEGLSDQDFSLSHHKMRVVERLDKLGILGDKTICAHCIHVNDNELELLKASDSIVVHNPQSNMNNSVGVTDIFKILDKDILLGLGTDAMTTNMLEEIRCGLWIHKLTQKDPSVGFMEMADLLLKNNAAIANRYWADGEDDNYGGSGEGSDFATGRLGEIEEGAVADVILMDYHSPTPVTEDSFAGHVIFGLSQSPVNTTIAGGKLLMHDKKILHLDEERIAAEARELSQKLWERF